VACAAVLNDEDTGRLPSAAILLVKQGVARPQVLRKRQAKHRQIADLQKSATGNLIARPGVAVSHRWSAREKIV
jgi:hypothetical protein